MASITTQLALKLSLEDKLRPQLRTVFNSIVKDFRILVATTGMTPTLKKYVSIFETVIDNHYKRVNRAFSGIVKAGKKQSPEQTDEDREEMLLLALLAWREKNARRNAELIMNTTRANMLDAIRLAQEQARIEGRILTTRELAAAAAAILRRKLKSRVSGIAITETQAPSESTKYIEAEVESGLTPRVLGGAALVATKSIKRWRTVGDHRVRKAHFLANYQEQPLNKPFVVNREYLMHPGDMSLGASLDNVVNCRCTAQYSVR